MCPQSIFSSRTETTLQLPFAALRLIAKDTCEHPASAVLFLTLICDLHIWPLLASSWWYTVDGKRHKFNFGSAASKPPTVETLRRWVGALTTRGTHSSLDQPEYRCHDNFTVLSIKLHTMRTVNVIFCYTRTLLTKYDCRHKVFSEAPSDISLNVSTSQPWTHLSVRSADRLCLRLYGSSFPLHSS